MPHDVHGERLKLGDVVSMEFTITAISPGDEYCNVTLESVLACKPGTRKTLVACNASQCELQLPLPGEP